MIAKQDLIEGMVKGMSELESFDTERQRLNATLAAQRAGITRTAARRHLLTLTHLGYLESDGRYFWLSSKVLRFTGSYLASARLPRLLQPLLERLALRLGQALSAVVLNGDEVVVIARSDGRLARGESLIPVLPYGLHLGARLPAHATSTGRVLLAAQSRQQLSAWLRGRTLSRLTPHTVTSVRQLRELLEQVRRDDYCLASNEHELGVHALAVPLRDSRGMTRAALNLVTTPVQVSEEMLRRSHLPLLQVAAREWSALL